MTLSSPSELRETLIRLFPDFASESGDTEVTTYHQVVRDLAPHLKRYLEAGSLREVLAFADIVNAMVASGGDSHNAMETCLLEHASQVGCAKLLRPHLSPTARRELR